MLSMLNNTVAAFRGMHVSPAEHSYEEIVTTRQTYTHIHTHGQTDAGQKDPYVPL